VADLDQARGALRAVADELLFLIPDTAQVRKQVTEAVEGLLKDDYATIVCGEFGRGKSTLLSAAVGRRHVFPHHPDDTTGVATMLAWGAEESAVIVQSPSAAGDQEGETSLMSIGLDQVQRFVTDAPATGGDQVVIVRMFAPFEILRSGLTLVDTPGFNSRNQAHNEITERLIGSADVLVFVTSFGEPVSEPELRVLRKSVGSDQRVLCVVSKADMGDPEDFIKQARKRLSKALSRPPASVPVIAVSANTAFSALRTNDRRGRDRSGITEFLAEIRRLGRARVAERAESAVVDIGAVLEEMLGAACAEVATWEQVSSDARAAERRLAELKDEISRVTRLRDGLQAQIAVMVQPQIETVREAAKARFAELRLMVTGDSTLFSAHMDPEEYLQNFKDQIVSVGEHADRESRAIVPRARAAWAQDTGIRLGPGRALTEIRNQLAPTLLDDRRSDRPGVSFAALRDGLTYGTLFAAKGAVIGGVVGGVLVPIAGPVSVSLGAGVGGLLGHLVGWFGGVQDSVSRARQEWRERRVHELAADAPNWVEQNSEFQDTSLCRSGDAIERLVAGDCTEALDRHRDGLEDELRRLEHELRKLKAARADGQDFAGALSAARARADQLDDLWRRYTAAFRQLHEVAIA
jgi:ethanolamine utilization protein EutP (predicted NTPase)